MSITARELRMYFSGTRRETRTSIADAKAAQARERAEAVAGVLASCSDVNLRTASPAVCDHYRAVATIALQMANRSD